MKRLQDVMVLKNYDAAGVFHGITIKFIFGYQIHYLLEVKHDWTLKQVILELMKLISLMTWRIDDGIS